jgi:hypothetical protein
MNRQFHVPAALTLEWQRPFPTEQDADWAPEQGWDVEIKSCICLKRRPNQYTENSIPFLTLHINVNNE